MAEGPAREERIKFGGAFAGANQVLSRGEAEGAALHPLRPLEFAPGFRNEGGLTAQRAVLARGRRRRTRLPLPHRSPRPRSLGKQPRRSFKVNGWITGALRSRGVSALVSPATVRSPGESFRSRKAWRAARPGERVVEVFDIVSAGHGIGDAAFSQSTGDGEVRSGPRLISSMAASIAVSARASAAARSPTGPTTSCPRSATIPPSRWRSAVRRRRLEF